MAKNNGMYYIKKAEKAGLIVKQGRGDHMKIYSPDGTSMMVIPVCLKGNGTEHTIVKWLVRFGVIIALLFMMRLCFFIYQAQFAL